MIWVDFVIVGIIALSAVISLVRGFVREAVSLAGWVVAVWLSITYMDVLALYLQPYIAVPSLRMAAAFATVFIGVLMASGFVVFIIGVVIDKTDMSGTDRVLGVVFGLARGVAIVGVVVALAGLTPVPQDPWWRQSVTLPHFERLVLEVRGALPTEISDQMQF